MCNECFFVQLGGFGFGIPGIICRIYILRLRWSALWHHLVVAEKKHFLVLGDAGIVDKINLKTIRLVNNNEELEALIKRKRILSTNHRTGF